MATVEVVNKSIIEAVLDREQVSYELFPAKLLSELQDTTNNQARQARLTQPIIPHLVLAYTAGYRNQDKFPPLVGWRPKSNGLDELIDGNQRLIAARNAEQTTHPYIRVLTTDPQVIDRLIQTINNRVNGQRLSPAEEIEHAISFHRRYDVTLKSLADDRGLDLSELTRAARSARIRDILLRNNVPLSKYPVLTADRLIRLSPLEAVGEEILVQAAHVVGRNFLGAPETESLLKAIKRARTHEAKMKVLADYEKKESVVERRTATKGGTVRTKTTLMPRDKLARVQHALAEVFGRFEEDASLQPPATQRRVACKEAELIVERLIRIHHLPYIRRRNR